MGSNHDLFMGSNHDLPVNGKAIDARISDEDSNVELQVFPAQCAVSWNNNQ